MAVYRVKRSGEIGQTVKWGVADVERKKTGLTVLELPSGRVDVFFREDVEAAPGAKFEKVARAAAKPKKESQFVECTDCHGQKKVGSAYYRSTYLLKNRAYVCRPCVEMVRSNVKWDADKAVLMYQGGATYREITVTLGIRHTTLIARLQKELAMRDIPLRTRAQNAKMQRERNLRSGFWGSGTLKKKRKVQRAT